MSGDYRQQISELTQENEFLKAAATAEGFCRLFFEEIPNHRTQVEAFNDINDRYFALIGEYRYSDYRSFHTVLRRVQNGKSNSR